MDQNRIKENFTFRKPLDQRFYRENYNKHSHWCLGSSIQINQTTFISDLLIFEKNESQPSPSGLLLQIYGLSTGGIRIRIDPIEKEKYERYDVSKEETIIFQSKLGSRVNIESSNQPDSNEITLTFPGNVYLIIQKDPFKIALKEDNKKTVEVNSFGQLLFEHGNKPVPNERHHFVHNDPIPQGASAVGVDFYFPSKDARLSGLPERASPLTLRGTKDEEPLRLFNSDSNKYEANNPVHLYGSVPLVFCHSPTVFCGLFWINASDTYASIRTIDSSNSNSVNNADEDVVNVEGKKISFVSETGFVDFVIFTGNFDSVLDSYSNLTGRPFMPPLFSFGYHQCKWGYLSQDEVESVMKGLDEFAIPYDAIWLDVDHLKKFSPFEVDEKNFPHLDQLCVELEKDKRHLVRLSDPHFPTRNSHKQYSECISHSDFYMKESNGKPYKGFCWPGRCIWPDFLNPQCRKWYSEQFVGTQPLNVHIWNDMNEPTIFMSDQFTFPKNVVHYNGTESRATHNIYGVLNTSATYSGCIANNQRAFILTRSFWSASQRYAFVWTGDNTASDAHMKISIDMILSLGLCGIPFVGADVGGFFGSPDHLFIAHWLRLASYTYPFFREHCIRTSERREPFLFKGKALDIAKEAINDRYKLISFWYTQAYLAHQTGLPITKPLWSIFPEIDRFHDNEISNNNNNGLPVVVGDSLLVNYNDPLLPPGRWFYLWNGKEKKSVVESSSNVDVCPFIESDDFVLLRGGKIVPIHNEIAKSAELTVKKPLTLIVAVDENKKAEGELFIDDGFSFNKGCVHRLFKYIDGVLTSQSVVVDGEEQAPEEIGNLLINKVRIYGVNHPASVDDGVDYVYENNILTLNNVNCQIIKDLTIKINF